MKMREVQEEMNTPQVPAKVAILAAMNISDELFSNKRTTEKMKNDVEGKISSLIEIVDEVIQQ
jgi:cell division protein ZapA